MVIDLFSFLRGWEALFSPAWAGALWRACWQGGLALLLVWGLCRAWKAMPPNLCEWLWRLAYLKLLLAWLLPATLALVVLPVALPQLPALPVHISARAPMLETPSPQSLTVNPNAPAVTPAPSVAVPAAPTIIVPSPEPTSTTPITRQPWRLADLFPWLGVLWLLGIGWGVLRLGLAIRHLRYLRATCRPVTDDAIFRLCAVMVYDMGLRCMPRLVSHPTAGPLLLGTLYPVIIVPEAMLAGDRDALKLALAHELAHVKRQDIRWSWLPVLVEVLFFFHPLVHLARHESRLAQEIAADAFALRHADASPQAYGAMLVEHAAHHAASRPIPVTVGIMESFHTIARRLHAISLPALTPRQYLLTGIVTFLVALVAFIPFQLTHNTSTANAGVLSAQGNSVALLEMERGTVTITRGGTLYITSGNPRVRIVDVPKKNATSATSFDNGEIFYFSDGKVIIFHGKTIIITDKKPYTVELKGEDFSLKGTGSGEATLNGIGNYTVAQTGRETQRGTWKPDPPQYSPLQIYFGSSVQFGTPAVVTPVAKPAVPTGTLSAMGEGTASLAMGRGTVVLTGNGYFIVNGNPLVTTTGTTNGNVYFISGGKATITGGKPYKVDMRGTVTALTVTGSGQAILVGKGTYTRTQDGMATTKGVWMASRPEFLHFMALSAHGEGNCQLLMTDTSTVTFIGSGFLSVAGKYPTVVITGTPGMKRTGITPTGDPYTNYNGFQGRAVVTGNKYMVIFDGAVTNIKATGSGQAVLAGNGTYTITTTSDGKNATQRGTWLLRKPPIYFGDIPTKTEIPAPKPAAPPDKASLGGKIISGLTALAGRNETPLASQITPKPATVHTLNASGKPVAQPAPTRLADWQYVAGIGTLSARGKGIADVRIGSGNIALTGSGELKVTGDPAVTFNGTSGTKTVKNLPDGEACTTYTGFRGKVFIGGDTTFAVRLNGTVATLTATGIGQGSFTGTGSYTLAENGEEIKRDAWIKSSAVRETLRWVQFGDSSAHRVAQAPVPHTAATLEFGSLAARGEGTANVTTDGTLVVTGNGNLTVYDEPSVTITGREGTKETRLINGKPIVSYRGFTGKAAFTSDHRYSVSVIGTVMALTGTGSGSARLVGDGTYAASQAGTAEQRGAWQPYPPMPRREMFRIGNASQHTPGTLTADGEGRLHMQFNTTGRVTLTGSGALVITGDPQITITGDEGKRTSRTQQSGRNIVTYQRFNGTAVITDEKPFTVNVQGSVTALSATGIGTADLEGTGSYEIARIISDGQTETLIHGAWPPKPPPQPPSPPPVLFAAMPKP